MKPALLPEPICRLTAAILGWVAKESAKRGMSVRDVVREKELLPDDKIDDALDVRSMTEPGLPD